jgi:hypothetical protein
MITWARDCAGVRYTAQQEPRQFSRTHTHAQAQAQAHAYSTHIQKKEGGDFQQITAQPSFVTCRRHRAKEKVWIVPGPRTRIPVVASA